jgi:hypothetical protein
MPPSHRASARIRLNTMKAGVSSPLRLTNIPARSAIGKVIPRGAIDIDDCWFPWAIEFALIEWAYIARIAPAPATGHWRQSYPQAPKHGGGGDRHQLDLGDATLSVDYLDPAGWTIDVIHEDIDDWDSRILTFVRGNLPVLCPTFDTATQVAEASYPNCHYHLCWRSTQAPRTRITDTPLT